MNAKGWKQLVEGWPWHRGAGSFPLLPNSEFMPPIRLVRKPYGAWDSTPVDDDDPWGWPISEYEEILSLRPGLHDLAGHILRRLVALGRGEEDHGISEYELRDNPYWPDELARHAGCLAHERFVLLLPLALSQTQDDKAHQRWTLFGNSEQGPARPFWKGFQRAPGEEVPAQQALDFLRDLLAKAYGEPRERLIDLRAAGFRILPQGYANVLVPPEGPLPTWTADYIVRDTEPLRDVKYLLTFRAFRDLPSAVRRKYLAGDLHLLPFPGSLLFWGSPNYIKLAEHLRLATQIPLLHFVERHARAGTIQVPQSGWFTEPGPKAPRSRHGHGPIRETYKRTYRQARVHRFEDALANAHEHRLARTLFSTLPHDVDLYHKPMARNVQLWTRDFLPLLDGPTATAADLHHAAEVVSHGGVFGYRFLFPAMHVGRHEMYWHRPLAAYLDQDKKRPALIASAPLGYLTAHGPNDTVELWPRLLRREAHVANIELFKHLKETPPHITMINVLKVLDAWERRGEEPLPRDFARALLTVPKRFTLEGWLRSLPQQAKPRHRVRAKQLADQLRSRLMPTERAAPSRKDTAPPSLTFHHTAHRAFEEEYWNTIAHLSMGDYANKNNADCVLDRATKPLLRHTNRDLERLGDYLLDYYARLAASQKMADVVRIGELPFHWQTQYPFPWMNGWRLNQDDETYERNLLVMIPGRDRSRAVIMADHYDTAYMHDCYDRESGGVGARLSAQGADDNCSATAALMLGARPFLELSKQGKLACDIWLLHLTGEEYPAEGLGTCRMCQWLVEGTLALQTPLGKHDLSAVRVQGVYVLDMIAHNIDMDRDVFQIAPGTSRAALWLAEQARQATVAWNNSTARWNRRPERRRAKRGRRSRDGATMPAVAQHLSLHGEVRPHFDPRSTLYNTDGQAFSDYGIPVVLFMENYDINRVGYHDTFDNMTMIDLDYGAALAAITIESVARAATQKPPDR